jgi:Phosphotransferase enzyme family
MTADSQTGHRPADVAESSARHPAAWRFLLPRNVDGPVVLANLGPITTENLLRSYPAAVVLARPAEQLAGTERAVLWDGRRSPLRPGSVALVVCDDRDGACAEALGPAVAADGQQVAIVPSGRPYRFALYPTPEQLRAVVGQGWPVTYDGSPRRWLGYWLAASPVWRHLSRSGLDLPRPGDSIVGTVLDQVGRTVGGTAELRGLIAGRGLGQVTLRARCAGQELAVRIAVSPDSAQRLANCQRVLAELPPRLGPGPHSFAFPEGVAAGAVDGIAWAAERWVKVRVARSWLAWRPGSRSWAALRAISADLGRQARTGQASPGWARSWVTGLDLVAPDLTAEILHVLAPIEATAMATAWCHGDLWPGNVFLRRPPLPPLVIDWERARPDAPAGLDALYVELCRVVVARRCSFGEAAARLARDISPELAAAEIGGRKFADWGRPEQEALFLAAVTHYATGENEGGSPDRWTRGWGELNIVPLLEVLRGLNDHSGTASDDRPAARSLGGALGSAG